MTVSGTRPKIENEEAFIVKPIAKRNMQRKKSEVKAKILMQDQIWSNDGKLINENLDVAHETLFRMPDASGKAVVHVNCLR